jgi:hypothetical protein
VHPAQRLEVLLAGAAHRENQLPFGPGKCWSHSRNERVSSTFSLAAATFSNAAWYSRRRFACCSSSADPRLPVRLDDLDQLALGHVAGLFGRPHALLEPRDRLLHRRHLLFAWLGLLFADRLRRTPRGRLPPRGRAPAAARRAAARPPPAPGARPVPCASSRVPMGRRAGGVAGPPTSKHDPLHPTRAGWRGSRQTGDPALRARPGRCQTVPRRGGALAPFTSTERVARAARLCRSAQTRRRRPSCRLAPSPTCGGCGAVMQSSLTIYACTVYLVVEGPAPRQKVKSARQFLSLRYA